MQPLKCTCGTCPTCKHREYQRRTRAKKEAGPRQPHYEHLTIEQAERLSLEQWLLLPHRVQQRIFDEYTQERTLA